MAASHSVPPPTKSREYLGWEDADVVEWKVKKETEGRHNWNERWGPCREFMKEHQKWVCSGISRAMRKPSQRSVEWIAWQRPKCPNELPGFGECKTRKKILFEPQICNNCRPCPWPITTAGEVGWLGQHKSCELEIYGNKYMQRPPLPLGQKKISEYLFNY